MTLTNEQQCMVEDNMGLVRAVLSRCVNSPGSTGIYSYDDLFQIGCMGLCEAVVQYRPGRAAFSTYAYAAIRNRIYNALTYATYRREKETLSDFLYEPASDVPKDMVSCQQTLRFLRKFYMVAAIRRAAQTRLQKRCCQEIRDASSYPRSVSAFGDLATE